MSNDDLIFQSDNVGIRRDGQVAFLRPKCEIAALRDIANEIKRLHEEQESKEDDGK